MWLGAPFEVPVALALQVTVPENVIHARFTGRTWPNPRTILMAVPVMADW